MGQHRGTGGDEWVGMEADLLFEIRGTGVCGPEVVICTSGEEDDLGALYELDVSESEVIYELGVEYDVGPVYGGEYRFLVV